METKYSNNISFICKSINNLQNIYKKIKKKLYIKYVRQIADINDDLYPEHSSSENTDFYFDLE